jgi:predicted nucleotidyltransferase
MKEKTKLLDTLVERLKKTFGDKLVSVVLYGSAAVGDDHQRYSDLNVFCVLGRVTPRELEDVEPVFRWWREQGHPAPLVMSEQEVRTSTDCFPIEFHDMKDRRRVLHGADVVEGLEIDDSFYRAQVEYQLRAKLLRLRQKGAGVLHDKELLVHLMADSVSTFLVLGRHALRLHGAEAPVAKRDVLSRIEGQFGLRADPFTTLLELREEKRKPKEVDARALYGQYLEGVEVLVAAVDRLAK